MIEPIKHDQRFNIISDILSMKNTIVEYEYEIRYRIKWYNYLRKNLIKKEIRYLSAHIEYYQLKLSFL